MTIPNGIEARDLAWLAKTRSTLRRQWGVLDDRLVLGFAGRLCRQKEPERLLELSLRLAERGSDALLLIFGAGPLEAELRARARRDGIEERIRWQGVETNRDAIFPGLDLLLLPSRWEGLPYALLDALEREVPVLATPVGGVPEVLAAASLQQCAMKWEVERWADWIDEGGPRRAREELRSGGRRSVLTAFSHDRMVADTRALYGRVLGR